MGDEIPEVALQALGELYSALESQLAPFRRSCQARGLCCNFQAAGHQLYVTGLEAGFMRKSGAVPSWVELERGACPYLHGTTCGIREHRALGCRIYYCDRTHEEERNQLYERFLKEIRAIEARFGLPHRYQPVTLVFGAGASAGPGCAQGAGGGPLTERGEA